MSAKTVFRGAILNVWGLKKGNLYTIERNLLTEYEYAMCNLGSPLRPIEIH